MARVEAIWQKNYVQLLPWTFLNSTIHKPPQGAAAFLPARDITTVKWHTSHTELTIAAPPDSAAATAGGEGAPAQLMMHRGLSDAQWRDAVGTANAHSGMRT